MSITVRADWDRSALAGLEPGKLKSATLRALRKAGSTALRDMRSEGAKRIRARKPGDPSGDFICTLDCLEPAFCPDYTATDFTRCQQHPLSSGCCPVGGDPANAVPCFSKKCIKGDRP